MRSIFFIVCLISGLMMSCQPQRQLIHSSQKDSVRVEYKEVEKRIYIPGDTVIISLPTPVISHSGDSVSYMPVLQTIETKRSKVKLTVDKTGQIEVQSICKELQEKVTVLEKTVKDYKTQIGEYQLKESKWALLVNNIKHYGIIALIVVVVLGLVVLFLKIF